MSAKQDRAAVRTPEDLERKYRFEKQFKDINKSLAQSQKASDDARKTASEAQKKADEAQKSYDSLNTKQGELLTKLDEMETRAEEIETNATNLSNTVDGLGRDLEERIGDVENYVGYPSTTNSIFKKVYPVGSIYMSVNSTSPATLFGGTWTQLKDRFLIGTGSTYSNGATGGATTHSHSASNMRALFGGDSNSTLKFHFKATAAGSSWTPNKMINVSSSAASDISLRYTGIEVDGNTASVNHMPPYLAVYMWKRTA